MLSFLFRTLTARPAATPVRGEALFDAVTAEARRPGWYREGSVPDTLDGRFAVLSTILALVLVRLERDGDAGNPVSVALTERFIHVMESEHRELGLGDPTLGKTVRKLVGMLAKRTDIARNGAHDFVQVAREGLYKGDVPESSLRYSADALAELARRLDRRTLDELEEGKIA